MLVEAAGLNVVMAVRDFDWDAADKPLGKVVADVLAFDIQRKKNAGLTSGALLGLGVTATCAFTGLPAVRTDDDGKRISSEIACKLKARGKADARLEREVNSDCAFTYDFNKIGDLGTMSYMAVAHTDGNGMGDRFKSLGKADLTSRDYVGQVRALSNSVNVASQKALQKTVEAMESAIEEKPNEKGKLEKWIGGVVKLTKTGERIGLPFRPIIFGGDDVTFVCDGRLGISAAEKYLDFFCQQSLSDGTSPTARAGIAITNTHFPFAQTYALAEALAANAKTRIREIQEQERRKDISVMDWHIATSGLVMNLAGIRRRDYTLPDKNVLYMRPVRMDESDTDKRSRWQFGKVWHALSGKSEQARNKVKALRTALRSGENATAEFLNLYKAEFEMLQTAAGNGWAGGHSTVFDAVEALEFYTPLISQMQVNR